MQQLMDGIGETQQLDPMPRSEPLRQDIEEQHMSAGQNMLRLNDEIDVPLEVLISGAAVLILMILAIIGFMLKNKGKNEPVTTRGLLETNRDEKNQL